MRADLAPFGVDLLLMAAGLGVLAAIGLVPKRAMSMLGALGLAYLTGSAAVPMALVATLVVGIPFTLVTFLLIVILCVGAGIVRWRKSASSSSTTDLRQWQNLRAWPVETWVVAVFVVVFAVYWTIGMFGAFKMPLTAWDAWSIWARKAEMLTVHDSLFGGFFTNQSYAFSHPDYPLQFPVWEALHFRAGAVFDTQTVLRHVWLLLGAFVWAIAYLLRERVRPLIWAPLLLLIAAAPGVWEQLLAGYADVPMAIFACLGATCMGLWLQDRDGRLLALGTIMLVATAGTKNEGLVAALAILAVAGAVALSRNFAMRPYLIAASVAILAILPWRIWLAAHGIEGDMPVFKGLEPGYLLGRIGRVGPAIAGIDGQLADQGRWLYLLPLAALVVAASLVSGIGRRLAVFYLASFALIWGALVWSYWISPYDLAWHISNSVDRVVSIPMFVCIAAVLHLSGLLLSALGRRRLDGQREPQSTTSHGIASDAGVGNLVDTPAV